ncbi:S8 family serine peptidase [Candidatus Saccharibacteria bacterium]|nr:S8 family serine peptidase [Candidatus Saccharibacteria bacterium]
MVRRKKSLLFSISLASAGLVAGALFVVSPKTQATEEELGATTTDAVINAISEDTSVPSEVVESSLKTHQLLMGIDNVKELEDNPDVVDYEELAKNVYAVTFKDYDSTSENYTYYKESEKASGVMLNLPMQLMGLSADRTQTFADPPTGYHEWDKCFAIEDDQLTFNNYTLFADQCLAWGVDSMKMQDYAQELTSANNVKVAVIDSGIRATQYAFSYASEGAKDRLDMSLAHDYVDNDDNPDDSQNVNFKDDEGNDTGIRNTHGTSVAATITESTPFSVKIVPIRITGGSDDNTPIDFEHNNTTLTGSAFMIRVLKAVSSVKGKVGVINLSLGVTTKVTKPYDGAYSLADQVMKEAKEAGTIIVAAAGNGGQNFVSWPAMSDYVIGVSSVNENKALSDFSQYGEGVDFAAPGESLILPTGDSDANLSFPTNGTSFSTPFVSAAVANILSEYPNYSFDDVYNELKLNAEDLGTAGYDTKFGWGSVSFHVNKFADLTVATPTTSTDGAWAKSATIDATATSSAYNVTHYAIQSGNTTKTAPTSWTAVSTSGKTGSASKTVTSNGTYTVWFKNSNNEIKAKTVTVSGIDTTAPTISTGFKVSDITDTGATLSIGVKDTQSGLAKIVWHYKLEDAESYTDETEEYATSGTGETATVTKTFTLSGLETGKTYKAYATVYDMANNSKDSATATFTATAGTSGVDTGGDEDPTEPTNPTNPTDPTDPTGQETEKPKPVNTTTTKNPKTADINILGIAGAGIALSTVAFIVFRAKRR